MSETKVKLYCPDCGVEIDEAVIERFEQLRWSDQDIPEAISEIRSRSALATLTTSAFLRNELSRTLRIQCQGDGEVADNLRSHWANQANGSA